MTERRRLLKVTNDVVNAFIASSLSFVLSGVRSGAVFSRVLVLLFAVGARLLFVDVRRVSGRGGKGVRFLICYYCPCFIVLIVSKFYYSCSHGIR